MKEWGTKTRFEKEGKGNSENGLFIKIYKDIITEETTSFKPGFH